MTSTSTNQLMTNSLTPPTSRQPQTQHQDSHHDDPADPLTRTRRTAHLSLSHKGSARHWRVDRAAVAIMVCAAELPSPAA
jgi:hypothetical protein